jgi:glycosyltransferase involved in cell wall biosynthesis
MDNRSAPGVSIVICSHNGGSRLPSTLAHIAAQKGTGALSWEVILIDNRSTDDTAGAAARSWPASAPVPLRIISESRLGRAYARQHGLAAARYEIVSFIDDDSLIDSRWVCAVAEVMAEHPEAGACGGPHQGLMEIPEPVWMEPYREYFGIGQMADAGRNANQIWGAGMSVRRKAWQNLCEAGFRLLTTNAQEDLEISYALRLAGWKLWLDPRLKLQHCLATDRLMWSEFLLVQRQRHAEAVNLDPYLLELGDLGALPGRLTRSWSYRLARTIAYLTYISLTRPHKVFVRRRPSLEGDHDVFRIIGHLGRLEGLIRTRRTYRANMRNIATATWRKEN